MSERELIGRCEMCDAAIFEGARYEPGDGMKVCKKHAATLADFAASPELFLDEDGEQHTPESAKAFVDARLAAGGSLEDKPFLIGGEG